MKNTSVINHVSFKAQHIINYTEHCSVWSYQTYRYYYYRQYADDSFTARMMKDFYGGRTGPLEKFYLFIYFLLMISDEDFYGGRTGPLEKFY